MLRASLAVRAGLGAAVAAAVFTGGCSSDPPVKRPSPATVEHWGSFFGGRAGNFDTQTSPVAMTVPGPVAEVGTSNSTEYALLKDGSLYAWGLGTQGQLGDGRTEDSFAKPVRVRALIRRFGSPHPWRATGKRLPAIARRCCSRLISMAA